MPTTLTQDLLDHIATAREDGSDFARGVLADRLQEEGDEDRAELIRVQVEATTKYPQGMNCGTMYCSVRSPEGLCDDCLAYKRLSRRESALLSRNPAWLSVPCPSCGRGVARAGTCQLCGGSGDLLNPYRTDFHARNADEWGRDLSGQIEPRAALTRGFLTVTQPSALCWRECPECGATGRRGLGNCLVCNATGTAVHPVLAAILASPVGIWVEAVRVSDREPIDEYPHSSGDPARGGWGWRDEGLENGPENIPSALLTGDVALIHPTADAANDALARHLPRWARARLGERHEQ